MALFPEPYVNLSIHTALRPWSSLKGYFKFIKTVASDLLARLTFSDGEMGYPSCEESLKLAIGSGLWSVIRECFESDRLLHQKNLLYCLGIGTVRTSLNLSYLFD